MMHHNFGWDFNGIIGERVIKFREFADPNFENARFLLPLEGAGADGETRLRDHAGIEFRQEEGKVFVDGLAFGRPAEQLGIDWDWEVVKIEQAADRPPKELFFIPALLLVALIYLLQMRRKTRLEQGV